MNPSLSKEDFNFLTDVKMSCEQVEEEGILFYTIRCKEGSVYISEDSDEWIFCVYRQGDEVPQSGSYHWEVGKEYLLNEIQSMILSNPLRAGTDQQSSGI